MREEAPLCDPAGQSRVPGVPTESNVFSLQNQSDSVSVSLMAQQARTFSFFDSNVYNTSLQLRHSEFKLLFYQIECASVYLVVDALAVQSNVDCEGRRVVMWP